MSDGTTQVPHEEGYYWFEGHEDEGCIEEDEPPRIVWVAEWPKGEWDVRCTGCDMLCELKTFHGRWIGPLEKPEKPE